MPDIDSINTLDSGGESFQAHCCFGTTTGEGPLPEPNIFREYRCKVTRTAPVQGVTAAAAAGIYFIRLTEDIGSPAIGQSADIDISIGTNAAQLGVYNILKVDTFTWKVELFTVSGIAGMEAFTLSDLINTNVGATVNVSFKRVDPA